MIIISDTSPRANLAAVGQLDLLRQFYKHAIIISADLYQRVLQAVAE